MSALLLRESIPDLLPLPIKTKVKKSEYCLNNLGFPKEKNGLNSKCKESLKLKIEFSTRLIARPSTAEEKYYKNLNINKELYNNNKKKPHQTNKSVRSLNKSINMFDIKLKAEKSNDHSNLQVNLISKIK